MEPDDYAVFPSYWDDTQLRRWNLWGYVDCRDVALACRLGLEAATTGAEVCIIAAADTVMPRPSADLMAEVFPSVQLTRRSRAARRCSRSTGPAGSWATSPPIDGPTTSRSPDPRSAAWPVPRSSREHPFP